MKGERAKLSRRNPYNDSLTCIMMTSLSDERVEGAAATVGNYVLFAGGLNSGKKDIVDVYTID